MLLENSETHFPIVYRYNLLIIEFGGDFGTTGGGIIFNMNLIYYYILLKHFVIIRLNI